MEARLCLLEKKDLDQALDVLAEAMLPLPLHEAVFGGTGPKEAREIRAGFAGLFQDIPGIVWTARQEGRIVGVCRMKSCQGSEPPSDEQAESKDPKTIWHQAWDRLDPKEAHWHLGPIGVLPGFQGRGIGSALLARFCAEVDACGSPAYLETDRRSSVRLYEKFGFRLTAQEEVVGVPNYFMWRPAA